MQASFPGASIPPVFLTGGIGAANARRSTMQATVPGASIRPVFLTGVIGAANAPITQN
jgi:hypothetical protein